MGSLLCKTVGSTPVQLEKETVGMGSHWWILFPGLQVICKNCNNCRDLDLCKDPYQGLDSHGM